MRGALRERRAGGVRGDAAVLLAAVTVPVLGAGVSGLTGAGLLAAGVPVVSVLLLSWLAAALVALLGSRAVVRRLAPESDRRPWAVVGPLLLAGVLAGPGDSGLDVRAGVVALVVGAGLLGLRAQPREPRVPRDDRGSGSLEFVGVVVLAGVLTTAAVGTVVASSPAMSSTIETVICQITGGSCQRSGNALTDDDVLPEACDVYTEGKAVSTVVDVAFVRLGGTMGLERVDKSDGSIEISVVDQGEAGLVASAGGKGGVTLGKNSYSADLEAEAALTGGVLAGETWVFQDRAQADAFQSYVERELAEDVVSAASPVIGLVNGAVEWITDEQPPRNDGTQKTVVRGDVTGTASAGAGFGYGAGASGEATFTEALGVELDRGADPDDPSDDTRTDFVQIDWEIAGQLGVPAVKGIDGTASSSGILKITRDTRGQVTQVALVDRAGGDWQAGLAADGEAFGAGGSGGVALSSLDFKGGQNSSLVVTRTLDLRTSAQRDDFGDWLLGGGGALTTGGQLVPGVDAVDGSGIVAGWGGEAFAERLRREGRTSVVEYDGGTWGLGGVLEAGLGVKVGLDVGYSSQDATAVTAYYLGAPDGSGSREAYPLPTCVR